MTIPAAPAEVGAEAPAEKLAPRSPAERMRRSRERRRKGLRALMIELRETEVDALVRLGRLAHKDRDDLEAIRKALYGFIELHLVAASMPYPSGRRSPAT